MKCLWKKWGKGHSHTIYGDNVPKTALYQLE